MRVLTRPCTIAFEARDFNLVSCDRRTLYLTNIRTSATVSSRVPMLWNLRTVAQSAVFSGAPHSVGNTGTRWSCHEMHQPSVQIATGRFGP